VNESGSAVPDFTPTDFQAVRTEPGFIGWSDNGPIFAAPSADFALVGEGPPYWPRADERIQRANTDGGSMLDGPGKGLWHSTETDGWPGYATGSFPHLTVHVEGGRFVARQHIPFTRAARALRNESGGVQTNRITRCQVEIVDRADLIDMHGLKPPIEDGLADLAQWLEAEWGVPRVCTVQFLTYPESFGDSPVRLGPAAWERYTGWLGHMHAAENDHGDPGALDWRPILLPKEDDVTQDELLDALESDRGQAALRRAVTDVARAGFGGLHPDATGPQIRPSQAWLFDAVGEIYDAVVELPPAPPA
jgi:hypothetical protein